MIVRATKDDETAVCDAFKLAMQQNPLSFLASEVDCEDADDLSSKFGLSKYFDPNDKSVLFIEKVGEVVEGTGTIEVPTDPRLAHNATLSWLWVANHRRGVGLGASLVQERFRYLESLGSIETVHVIIVACQTKRIEFHLEHGFKIVGTLKKHMKFDDVYYDVIVMQKMF